MFKLESGKVYLTRGGDRVEITIDRGNGVWPYYGSNGISYLSNGSAGYGFDDSVDIVSEYNPDSNEVNSPSHYTQGEIECIDAIQAQLTPEEFRGYLKGNIAKYMWRERSKQGKVSLEKAQWYLNKLIQETE